MLQFPQGNGLQLQPTTGTIANDAYTIVMLFKFANVDGYRRIIDFENGSSDNGFYILNGNLDFFSDGDIAVGSTAIPVDTYVQVALTRTAAGVVTAYLNGVQEFSFNDSGNDAVIDFNNALRFFKDDEVVIGEESAGSVARIRLYDCVLTASEIAALDHPPPGLPTRASIRRQHTLPPSCPRTPFLLP